MVNQGYDTQDLGPMVKEALLIQHWDAKENPLINISYDRQFIKIEFHGGDQGIAERVLLDGMVVSQMSSTLETEPMDLLGVPKCLWSQHKTDVGLVKSTQPIKIKLKQVVRLPYQRQYPLTAEAILGIKPIE